MTKKVFLLLFLGWGVLMGAPAPTPESDLLGTQIQTTLDSKLHSPYRTQIAELYRLNGFKALWVGPENAANYAALLHALENPLYNYNHKDFNLNEIKRLSFLLDNGELPPANVPAARARLDVLMSDALMRLLHFIRVGDVDWPLVQQKLKRLKETQDVQAAWDIRPKKLPETKELYQVLNQKELAPYLRKQLPLEPRYRKLLALLAKYRTMPNFPKLSYGRTLRINSTDSRIPQIKRMLKFFGDYPKHFAEDNQFDRPFAQAIRSFRSRFKLPPGNTVDNKVIQALNTTKKEYLRKILVNLEKLKLYPHRWEPDYVEVNVPEFKMRFYRNGQPIFSSDVVVGRIDRPTPIFDSKMTYMVLNPTWTIPDNLVRRDLIPMLKKEPDYLQKHNIHVYTSYKPNAPEVELDFEKLFSYEHDTRPIPYRFVQFPSDQNALGRVKFMFPNKYSVYLHDTDNKKLFGYRYRVFSSGCMRVAKPFDFMDLLLHYARGNYSEGKIQEILASNKPTTIRLKKAIPVHIVYFTVRREGKKDYFFYDIYLYDKMIWESMEGHKKASFRVPEKRLNPLRKERKRRRHFF
ncbi:L,D-transpeptidase family protein [Nitratifractor salsuginis]|uniref:ErfK/YbiS/YcfS/YnhG family protein n=1 Tax=Nitratifractor salsuginis (strain DSM 16511 / JCM 12458 / E9I37-1) TaxID=749222 RepID=E6X3M1_NITSE|nr:L,D-transpeptidase family protein [Nitratifractor salsuginis]ADV47360.1 ErfK/YbiS/YcfS/YnhG family protein [Nitratifractor salsuginis DSM 16511]